MKGQRDSRLRAAAGLPAVALALTATIGHTHHAATMFEPTKTITIQGTIKTFEWTNPHVWIWVSVPNAQGEIKVWGIESANLSMAHRMGMDKRSFKPGDKVTMVINPLRDGREGGGRFRRATFEDGHVLDLTPGNQAAAPAAKAE